MPGRQPQQEQEQMQQHTNRLAKEQSPYLLQHAHNPVDWYPWGEEAFAAARQQDKPIFLSVGYATCHWCHVMEAESFESEATAAVMNRHFINIKVDREERPDVDRVYMTFVQASTGGGGWPMSVWLTPELQPFYGGTYYPAADRYGMPSFTTVLKRIAQLWDTKRDDLQEQAASVMQQLREFTAPDEPPAGADGGGPGATAALMSPQQLSRAVLGCAASLAKGFDSKLGGFGGPPKFPRPSEINLLLRAAATQAAADASAGSSGSSAKQAPSAALLKGMSMFTLQAMAAGGMYDQLGGGFHRYSVDEFWMVPHFEKMLYDNPQLALTYLDAFRVTLAAQRSSSTSSGSGGGPSSTTTTTAGAATAAAAAVDAGAALAGPIAAAAAAVGAGGEAVGGGGGGLGFEDAVLGDPRVYATVVRGVLDYLRRDMTHPEGGLYSAEDADSLDPATNKKSEGAFYVWGADEIEAVLGQQRAPLFAEVYGVQADGNVTLSPRSDPHGEFKGKNVLAEFVRVGATKAVAEGSMTQEAAREMLGDARRALFDRRATRPRPSLDDKIVTAWNGQGISAFALASRALAAEQPPTAPCFPVDGCEPQEYMKAALAVAGFVQKHLWDPSRRRLRRAFCKAPSAVEGFADDYALLIQGLLDLYEAGGGLQWLQWATELQDVQDSLFWEPAGGYFQTSGADASVLLRLKEDYDGAELAASSIAAANLLRLAALLPHGASPAASGDGSSSSGPASSSSSSMSYGARADAVLAGFSTRLQQVPIAMPQMCVAAWLKSRAPLRQVIIAGSPSHPATSALLDAAHAAWAPDKAVMLIDPADPASAGFWKASNPEAWAMLEAHLKQQQQQEQGASSGAEGGGGGGGGGMVPTAFVCQNFTCQAPTTSPDKVYELLSRPGGGGGGGGVRLQPVRL